MLASQQRKLNQFQSKTAFMHVNAQDFPSNLPGGRTVQKLETEIQTILSLAGQQSSNVLSQHLGSKADNLDKLIRLLRKINRAADSMADEYEGVEDLFRLPRRRSEQSWLAAARTFHHDSASYNDDFIDYDLPANFRAQLMTLVGQIENTDEAADIAGAQKGGATGALVEAFRRAGKLSRRLDGIVENKYDDRPQKLAEWKIAAHLKAAPERADNPATTAG